MSAFCSSSDDLLGAAAAWGLGRVSVLIDGEQLSRLLIRYNVGRRDEELLHRKKTDECFFESAW
jgi:restriction system protein